MVVGIVAEPSVIQPALARGEEEVELLDEVWVAIWPSGMSRFINITAFLYGHIFSAGVRNDEEEGCYDLRPCA